MMSAHGCCTVEMASEHLLRRNGMLPVVHSSFHVVECDIDACSIFQSDKQHTFGSIHPPLRAPGVVQNLAASGFDNVVASKPNPAFPTCSDIAAVCE
jgi:hypothetical protein